jgi:hypothetical protein
MPQVKGVPLTILQLREAVSTLSTHKRNCIDSCGEAEVLVLPIELEGQRHSLPLLFCKRSLDDYNRLLEECEVLVDESRNAQRTVRDLRERAEDAERSYENEVLFHREDKKKLRQLQILFDGLRGKYEEFKHSIFKEVSFGEEKDLALVQNALKYMEGKYNEEALKNQEMQAVIDKLIKNVR